MPTNRTPIRRAARALPAAVTPATIDAFRNMLAVARTGSVDDYHAAYRDLHREVESALDAAGATGLWPVVVNPDDPCCYPPETGGALSWPLAQEIWRLLQAAAEESRS